MTLPGSIIPDAAPDAPPTPPRLAPLETGDHLTRDEFERRYDAMPHLKKAELIEGVVYMPSPVRVRAHGNPQYILITWLGIYGGQTPGTLGADKSSVRLDLESMPQPDGLMMLEPSFGGRAQIDADD